MKLKGILGKGSGKLGSSVFAINGGEQIVREYNPRVSNPKTDAQVAQRAKFKLLSQLAQVLSPANGFKKKGLVSARNQFVSINANAVTFANEEAKANLNELKVATGNKALYNVVLSKGQDNKYTATAYLNGEVNLSAVIFAFVKITEGGGLIFDSRQVVTTPNLNGAYVTAPVDIEPGFAVYAFGINYDSNSVSQNYGNIVADGEYGRVSNSIIDKILSSATSTTESFCEIEYRLE